MRYTYLRENRPETSCGREPLERRVARDRRETASEAPKSAAGHGPAAAADKSPQMRFPAPSTTVRGAAGLRPRIGWRVTEVDPSRVSLRVLCVEEQQYQLSMLTTLVT